MNTRGTLTDAEGFFMENVSEMDKYPLDRQIQFVLRALKISLVGD
jgi:hypothetical protein